MAMPLVQGLVEFSYAHQRGPIHVPLHVHHFSQMDVIIDGSMVLQTPGRRQVLRKGDSTLIPPLCRHGFEIATRVEHASFKLHVHPQYSAMLGRRPRVARLQSDQLAIARSAGRWRRDDKPLSFHGAMSAATYYLVHLLDDSAPSSADPADRAFASGQMWDLLGGVIADPHAGWTVARLAEQGHVSEGHFTKMFVRAFGQTPQRFLLESRIWDAADRLTRDDRPIKSVAEQTGYASVHSFSRAFKRAMGVSPAAYVHSQGRL